MEYLFNFLIHLNPVSYAIVLILAFMSILSWYIILTKLVQLGVIYWRSQKTLKSFCWHTPSSHEERDPFSRTASQAIYASHYYEQQMEKRTHLICSHSEFITRCLRRAINTEAMRLESGLTILATTANTSPFIGLLGTVLGIYHALLTIGQQGNASLDTIAIPIGEALIMTALGLSVAIPAVLGYNGLIRGHRAFLHQLEGFAHDLHTFLNTGGRLITPREKIHGLL